MVVSSYSNNIYIMVTVDWEVDTTKYSSKSQEIDYGGILVGTPIFETILDELEIPCTWFIETHCDNSDRNIPTIFPSIVHRISSRQADEIGVHIHWSRQVQGKNDNEYPTWDASWVDRQLKHAKITMMDSGIDALSFRGGAFLPVPNLPCLLERNGYLNDSSTLYGRSERRILNSQGIIKKKTVWEKLVTIAIKNFKPFPNPYFCSHENVEIMGNANVVEFSTNFSLFLPSSYASQLEFLLFMQKIRMSRNSTFIVSFFHIYELTIPGTGANELKKIDYSAVTKMRSLLKCLKRLDNVRFVTLTEARKLFLDQSDK